MSTRSEQDDRALLGRLTLEVEHLKEQLKDEVLCQETGHAARINKMEHRWTGVLVLWAAIGVIGPVMLYVSQLAVVGEIRAMEHRIAEKVKGP